MTSSNAKKPCATCSKCAGVTTCDGCQQSFCVKHFVEHRQELAHRMEHIGQEHDLLRRDLEQYSTNNNLFSRINAWEQESIAKIQIAAEAARTDLHELLDKNKNEHRTLLTEITTELQACRDSDDYTEMDINKWTGQLQELRKMLESPSSIRIDEKESSKSVIRLIEVRDQYEHRSSAPTSGSLQPRFSGVGEPNSASNERFNKIFGEATISEDSLVVTCHTDSIVSRPIIHGANRYSSGMHRIHFRIDKIRKACMFFGIIASSAMVKSYTLDKSRYGWLNLGAFVVNGERRDVPNDNIVETGDEVTLILDCDNQQIRVQHHRTNQLRQLPIDLDACPFPWKTAVILESNGDCARILP